MSSRTVISSRWWFSFHCSISRARRSACSSPSSPATKPRTETPARMQPMLRRWPARTRSWPSGRRTRADRDVVAAPGPASPVPVDGELWRGGGVRLEDGGERLADGGLGVGARVGVHQQTGRVERLQGDRLGGGGGVGHGLAPCGGAVGPCSAEGLLSDCCGPVGTAGSVKGRRSRSRSDAVGALDGFCRAIGQSAAGERDRTPAVGFSACRYGGRAAHVIWVGPAVSGQVQVSRMVLHLPPDPGRPAQPGLRTAARRCSCRRTRRRPRPGRCRGGRSW